VVRVYEVNKKQSSYFRYKWLVTSNVVLSLSAKSKQNALENVFVMDTDSYYFAVDTCTSETICKHKELFVGDIKSCKKIFVQGVAGKVQVTGDGTIKLRITDDDGLEHDLLVHNVLYVPESPINLISPQRWLQGTKNPNGTGEITVGESTLLFWDDRKYTKLIPHQPSLGIPVMSVNDGYTKTAALFTAALETMPTCYQPCSSHHSYLNTSQTIPIQDTVHIIPIEDDDLSIHQLPH
jgi:hypothetical protein